MRCRGPATTVMCGQPLPASLPKKCWPIWCLPACFTLKWSHASLSNGCASLVLLPLSLYSSLPLAFSFSPSLSSLSLPLFSSSFFLRFASFCCAFSLRPSHVPRDLKRIGISCFPIKHSTHTVVLLNLSDQWEKRIRASL